jgi:hypothetical protein
MGELNGCGNACLVPKHSGGKRFEGEKDRWSAYRAKQLLIFVIEKTRHSCIAMKIIEVSVSPVFFKKTALSDNERILSGFASWQTLIFVSQYRHEQKRPHRILENIGREKP